LFADLFFKCVIGLGAVPAYAQDGNLQADLESSIPRVDVDETPEVRVVTPPSTTMEPKTTVELVSEVGRVVSDLQTKLGCDPTALPGSPSAGRRARTGPTRVAADEMSVLIQNLLPASEASPPLVARTPEEAVCAITSDNIASAPRKNLVNIVPEKKAVSHPGKSTSKIVLDASLPAGHTFRSNALRSNIRQEEDWVFASGPNAVLAVPVGKKDKVTASLSTTSRRFARLSGSNRDLGNGFVRYTHVVANPIGGPTSKEGIAFEGTTLISWDEGFTGKPTSFSGPTATWFLYSVPVGTQKCGSKKPVPCYTVDVEAVSSYTWSNVPVLDNAAIGGSLKLSRAIPDHDLSISGKIGLTGSLFPNEREDRLDGGLSASASIAWQIRPSTRLSAGVSYGYNRSTISTNDWDGYDLLPSVNFTTTLGEWVR
jgi:hypothetical protein